MQTIPGQFVVRAAESDSDFEAYLTTHNRWQTYTPLNLESLKRSDRSWPADKFLRRYLAYDGEHHVTSACLMQQHWQTNDARWQAFIHAYSGISGGAFAPVLAFIEAEARERGCTTLDIWQRDDEPLVMSTLAEAGFVATQSNPESVIDLQGFDGAAFAASVESFDQSGYVAVTLKDFLAANSEGLRTWWDASHTLMEDVPVPWEFKKPEFEQFASELLGRPEEVAGTLLAFDGPTIIGVSTLAPCLADKTKYWTGLTGVSRSYRRQGIAASLKVRNLLRAKSEGGLFATCDNEADNPMLSLNLRLGFRTLYSWVCLVKSLD